MKLDYDNKRTQSQTVIDGAKQLEKKSPLELFEEFYEKQNNQLMSEAQRKFTSDLLEQLVEDEK